MKDFILVTLAAFALACVFGPGGDKATVPMSIGNITHSVYGTVKTEKLYPEMSVTDDTRLYRFVERINDQHGSNGVDFPRTLFDN